MAVAKDSKPSTVVKRPPVRTALKGGTLADGTPFDAGDPLPHVDAAEIAVLIELGVLEDARHAEGDEG